MTVNGVNGTNGTGVGAPSAYGMGGAMDSACRDIQKQIEQTQKRLSDLSENEEMPIEEKMKKRQEIQKEITELNQQLRQRQIEVRKQAQQQKKENTADRQNGREQKTQSGAAGAGSGMSGAGMQAMISADISMKQAQVQGRVATQLEGRSHVLESEIKMDKSRGSDTSKKEEELADLKQSIQDVSASQGETLAEAGKTLREASKEEQESKADKIREEKDGDEKAPGDAENREKGVLAAERPEDGGEDGAQLRILYTPVDVRL